MTDDVKKMKLRLYRKKVNALMGGMILCPVCRKGIKEEDLDNVEYIKTKRHTEIFVHRNCVNEWGRW